MAFQVDDYLARDLISHLLAVMPGARYSAADALTHPWLIVDDHDEVVATARRAAEAAADMAKRAVTAAAAARAAATAAHRALKGAGPAAEAEALALAAMPEEPFGEHAPHKDRQPLVEEDPSAEEANGGRDEPPPAAAAVVAATTAAEQAENAAKEAEDASSAATAAAEAAAKSAICVAGTEEIDVYLKHAEDTSIALAIVEKAIADAEQAAAQAAVAKTAAKMAAVAAKEAAAEAQQHAAARVRRRAMIASERAVTIPSEAENVIEAAGKATSEASAGAAIAARAAEDAESAADNRLVEESDEEESELDKAADAAVEEAEAVAAEASAAAHAMDAATAAVGVAIAASAAATRAATKAQESSDLQEMLTAATEAEAEVAKAVTALESAKIAAARAEEAAAEIAQASSVIAAHQRIMDAEGDDDMEAEGDDNCEPAHDQDQSTGEQAGLGIVIDDAEQVTREGVPEREGTIEDNFEALMAKMDAIQDTLHGEATIAMYPDAETNDTTASVEAIAEVETLTAVVSSPRDARSESSPRGSAVSRGKSSGIHGRRTTSPTLKRSSHTRMPHGSPQVGFVGRLRNDVSAGGDVEEVFDEDAGEARVEAEDEAHRRQHATPRAMRADVASKPAKARRNKPRGHGQRFLKPSISSGAGESDLAVGGTTGVGENNGSTNENTQTILGRVTPVQGTTSEATQDMTVASRGPPGISHEESLDHVAAVQKAHVEVIGQPETSRLGMVSSRGDPLEERSSPRGIDGAAAELTHGTTPVELTLGASGVASRHGRMLLQRGDSIGYMSDCSDASGTGSRRGDWSGTGYRRGPGSGTGIRRGAESGMGNRRSVTSGLGPQRSDVCGGGYRRSASQSSATLRDSTALTGCDDNVAAALERSQAITASLALQTSAGIAQIDCVASSQREKILRRARKPRSQEEAVALAASRLLSLTEKTVQSDFLRDCPFPIRSKKTQLPARQTHEMEAETRETLQPPTDISSRCVAPQTRRSRTPRGIWHHVASHLDTREALEMAEQAIARASAMAAAHEIARAAAQGVPLLPRRHLSRSLHDPASIMSPPMERAHLSGFHDTSTQYSSHLKKLGQLRASTPWQSSGTASVVPPS
eukprot:scaffold149807_cov30-Tisochrysis_lutea.AAC.3